MVFLFWFDMIRIIHQLIQKINNKIADKQGSILRLTIFIFQKKIGEIKFREFFLQIKKFVYF